MSTQDGIVGGATLVNSIEENLGIDNEDENNTDTVDGNNQDGVASLVDTRDDGKLEAAKNDDGGDLYSDDHNTDTDNDNHDDNLLDESEEGSEEEQFEVDLNEDSETNEDVDDDDEPYKDNNVAAVQHPVPLQISGNKRYCSHHLWDGIPDPKHMNIHSDQLEPQHSQKRQKKTKRDHTVQRR